MHTSFLITPVETFKHMISGPDNVYCFLIFFVLVSFLAIANNNKKSKIKQMEQDILENGSTFEKACFCEKRASDFKYKAFIAIFLGLILLISIIENKTFTCCVETICAFTALVYIVKMVNWHNRAVPHFQKMRRETVASLGPDRCLPDFVSAFMECTEYKDPYLPHVHSTNEKTEDAIREAEKELLLEILLEMRREDDVARPVLSNISRKLSEIEKTEKAGKFVVTGLQERLRYIIEYDRFTLKSPVRALIHAMKLDEGD